MASKPRTPTHYYCPLWRMNYYFFVGWPWTEFKAHMVSEFGLEVERQSIPAGTTIPLFDTKRMGICIWVKSAHDASVWAHECLHATNLTLDLRGVVADFNNDEPQAYLMMNIMSQGMK